MTQFTQQVRDDIATFTLTIGDDLIARWTVEFCGEIQEFTYEDWVDYGHDWMLCVLEDAQKPLSA